MTPPLLTTQEVAAILKVKDAKTVRALVKSKKLKRVIIGERSVRFREEDVQVLGHENIATTARYAHASEDDVRTGLFGQSAHQTTQNTNKDGQVSASNERPTGT